VFQWVEFDGAGDQAGSGVCVAAGGVAQAGADGFDRAVRSGRWRMVQLVMSARKKRSAVVRS
jgi:hypothetical protein